MSVSSLVEQQQFSKNALNILSEFLEKQKEYEQSKTYDKWRFVGYVLELGYDVAKIITSDPYKKAVGGIPRGSFLIMVPEQKEEMPLHFTLLRVKDVATTPLNSNIQQTYFELQKKSMPALDVWTASELQWGALDCDVLGMYYINETDVSKLQFSGDINNILSPHKYRIYSPDNKILDLIINGTVNSQYRKIIGNLRPTECLLGQENINSKINVNISMKDFMGYRTAMFGKTRLGKSNVVKLIAQGILDTSKNVGQVIFDINGEYANDNDQDGKSLRSRNEDRCEIYALTQRNTTPSKSLRLNFYEFPGKTKEIISQLLEKDNQNSLYIKAFKSVELAEIDEVNDIQEEGLRKRTARKIQMYWAILKKAGFEANETKLKKDYLQGYGVRGINPAFAEELRIKAYGKKKEELPKIETLDDLIKEFETIYKYYCDNKGNKECKSNGSGKSVFDADDEALLKFLNPNIGTGPMVLADYKKYHSKNATDFIKEILCSIDNGKTVILDLSSASDEMKKYFSDIVSWEIFRHQEKKFVTDKLKENEFVQLYFEEAHNIFPQENDKDLTKVYSRFAKEGAKFHIGMVYSTQSPSTISKDLLIQTENFFIGHISSQDEVKALSRLQICFSGVENDILKTKTPGYVRILTQSHRFVIPMQAYLYKEITL